MELAVVLVSLGVVALVYLHVSRQDGSFVNVLTPDLAIFVPANYLVDIVLLAANRPGGSLYAYVLTYGSYAVLYASAALGYSTRIKRVRLPLSERAVDGSPAAAWIVLLFAVLLYSPVLIQFRAHLANPREIYELTRQGYGLYFFLSTMLCDLSVVLLLFSRAKVMHRVLFFAVALVFLYLHGSKGQMLVPLLILAVWWVYVLRRGVSLMGFAAFGTIMVGIGFVLFLLTNPVMVLGSSIEGLVSYSDYTRNGMLVIDSNMGPLFGQLTWEGEVFTRVPRALFPDKPTLFGGFRLAEYFFPEAFNRGTGAPAFGFGSFFADFGVGTVLVMGILGFFKGVLLRAFANNLRERGSPGDMIMLLFGAGIPIIPFAGTFLLVESLVLATVANGMFAISRRRSVDDIEWTGNGLVAAHGDSGRLT